VLERLRILQLKPTVLLLSLWTILFTLDRKKKRHPRVMWLTAPICRIARRDINYFCSCLF
jgi:hypothetical protein